MKLLLYCTKAKPYLYYDPLTNCPFYFGCYADKFYGEDELMNGKIVAECDFEVEEIYIGKSYGFPRNVEIVYTDSLRQPIYLSQKSCLKLEDICEYLNHKGGYAIHIKNLHIFDKPRELSEYYKGFTRDEIFSKIERINTAPQNMMYAYKNTSYSSIIMDKYVLISIRPEWLCKILNGEKTIEVRKKVLKEML